MQRGWTIVLAIMAIAVNHSHAEHMSCELSSNQAGAKPLSSLQHHDGSLTSQRSLLYDCDWRILSSSDIDITITISLQDLYGHAYGTHPTAVSCNVPYSKVALMHCALRLPLPWPIMQVFGLRIISCRLLCLRSSRAWVPRFHVTVTRRLTARQCYVPAPS